MQLIVGCRARGASWGWKWNSGNPWETLDNTRTCTQLLISHPRARVQGDPFRVTLDLGDNWGKICAANDKRDGTMADNLPASVRPQTLVGFIEILRVGGLTDNYFAEPFQFMQFNNGKTCARIIRSMCYNVRTLWKPLVRNIAMKATLLLRDGRCPVHFYASLRTSTPVKFTLTRIQEGLFQTELPVFVPLICFAERPYN